MAKDRIENLGGTLPLEFSQEAQQEIEKTFQKARDNLGIPQFSRPWISGSFRFVFDLTVWSKDDKGEKMEWIINITPVNDASTSNNILGVIDILCRPPHDFYCYLYPYGEVNRQEMAKKGLDNDWVTQHMTPFFWRFIMKEVLCRPDLADKPFTNEL